MDFLIDSKLFLSFLLGAIQGVTEFLPISSSGHLIVFESLFKLDVEAFKSFDIVVHVGTLAAIILYFWNDIKSILIKIYRIIVRENKSYDSDTKLIFQLGLATIPAVIFGVFFEDYIVGIFRSPRSALMMMLILAVIFIVSEISYKKAKKIKLKEISYKTAVVIGFAQALALIPGISRSGSTISAGLIQGLNREDGARFSFLLGIPVIAGAGLLTALKMDTSTATLPFLYYVFGFIGSFVFGILSVSFLMKFIKNHSLVAFSVYLLIFSSIFNLII